MLCSRAKVFEVKMSRFLGYLRQKRAALEAMMFTLCLRLTDAERRIEVMAHRVAEQRLGRLLLRLAISRGRKGRVGLVVGSFELDLAELMFQQQEDS